MKIKKRHKKLFSLYPDKGGWVIRHFFNRGIEPVLKIPHEFDKDQFAWGISHLQYPNLFRKLLSNDQEPVFHWYVEKLYQKNLMKSLAKELVYLNLHGDFSFCTFEEACNKIKKFPIKTKIEIELFDKSSNKNEELQYLLNNLKDPHYDGFNLIEDGCLVPCYLGFPQASFFQEMLRQKNIPSFLARLEESIKRGDTIHEAYSFITVRWQFTMGNVVVRQKEDGCIFPLKKRECKNQYRSENLART